MSEIASFRSKLAPLAPYLDDPTITEIAVNRPGSVWLGYQRAPAMRQVALPKLTHGLLTSLAEVTASYTSQALERQWPLLCATMPIDLREGLDDAQRGGYRVQVVLPPAVEERTIALCIRKPTLLDMALSDYGRQQAFASVNGSSAAARDRLEEGVGRARGAHTVAPAFACADIDGDAATAADDLSLADGTASATLLHLYRQGAWEAFLRAAVRARRNIVISAGTNSGKTTLLNALLKEIPSEERIVTIEDAREIRPPQPNCLHLLYARGGQGDSRVTAVDLLEASLRLTPDRVIMGELRGAEAYAYLEMLNCGHDGSITTIHADSPTLMFERLAQMVMRFGSPLQRAEIIAYARSLIDVVVQLRRGRDGRRYVSEIRYEAQQRPMAGARPIRARVPLRMGAGHRDATGLRDGVWGRKQGSAGAAARPSAAGRGHAMCTGN